MYCSVKQIPQEIKQWNWGAFFFNICWGLGNRTYLPLLCIIPGFNLFWIFVCGYKGNEWAWKNGNYKDVETFMAVQETWNRAGLMNFIIAAILNAIILLFMFSGLMAIFNNTAYQ